MVDSAMVEVEVLVMMSGSSDLVLTDGVDKEQKQKILRPHHPPSVIAA